MIALLICDECDARVELSDPEVVAAAEVATFAEAHSAHETCAFTVRVAGRAGTLTYHSDVRPGRSRA